jgi:hypothetical protein
VLGACGFWKSFFDFCGSFAVLSQLFAVVCALLRLFAFLKFFKVVHVGEPARAAYNQVV